MRIIFRFILLLPVFVSVTIAQSPDVKIHFKSGDFIPVENAGRVSELPSLLSGSLFKERYYVALQFYSIPTEESRLALAGYGVAFGDYIPANTFLVSFPQKMDFSLFSKYGTRSIFNLEHVHKTDPAFFRNEIPEWAIKKEGFVDVQVKLYGETPKTKLQSELSSINALVLSERMFFRSLTLRLPLKNIQDLSSIPCIQWIEPIAPPAKAENLPGKTLHRSNILNDGIRNLTGSGVKIAEWDGGMTGPHLDFTGRLTNVETLPSSDHGTHVAGTMAGAGLLDPFARGMAPGAEIYSYDFEGSVNDEVASAILNYNIVMSQNSWGFGDGFVNCATRDPYNSNSSEQDQLVQTNTGLLIVFSTGNSQSVCSGGWGTTTGKAAKNIIAVGNVTSSEVISSSSSFGPVEDGRLKPDVCALGTSVYSTLPNNTYTGGYTGTSMACPGVSGTLAQLYQHYRQLNGNANPPASLMKAVLCNTGKDLGNAGPDYKHGYGRINGLRAARALETNRYKIDSLNNGQVKSFTISVPSGASRLRVMLAWTDPAAAMNSNPALVNDLDLKVTSPSSSVFNPWILDPANPGNIATRGLDRRNNIEQVTIDNPSSGNYTVDITGFGVPSGPRQVYSVTWEVEQPYMEVTYPNGGETLSPGASEIIMWDNSGVTSTQSVQYSLNNGSSWTTISSSVASMTNRLAWTVPSTFTRLALIRVTSGALSDVSDNNFSILGVPGGFTATTDCSQNGAIALTWSAVTNATHYDVLRLDTVVGIWNTLAADVTATNYLATGLTPGVRYWFTILAKNNANAITGQRAIAKSAIASNTTPLSTPSPVSGPSAVCGLQSNVVYSVAAVPNASSYQWSVPSGAIILSGQGTVSVSVAFGITGGNISVTSMNSCNTSSPGLKPVAVTYIATPAAITGSTAVCAGSGAINYTATAVPGATQYQWYLPSSVSFTGQGTNSIQANFAGESGEILVTASDGICTGEPALLEVAVTPLPTTPSISVSAPGDLCLGASVQLTATQSNLGACGTASLPQCNGVAVTSTIGNGTGSGSAIAYPSPYGNYYESSRQQFLVLASEMTAQGLAAGSITSLAFNVISAGTSGPHYNYTISLKCTNAASISAFETGAQTVYGPVTWEPFTGINRHYFSVPYNWDGVSNLIVEICHNNDVTTNLEYTENARATYTVTPFTSCVVRRADNGGSQCGNPAVSLTSSNRPNMLFTGCGNGTLNYNWSPNTGLSSATGNPVVASPSGSISYSVIAVNGNGCSSNSSPRPVTVISCLANLNLKLYIEGYYLGSGTLAAAIDAINYPSVSDTVTVCLANSTAPYSIVATYKGILSTSGNGIFSFTTANPAFPYYVVVKHRNSIETWSANPVSFVASSATYDFTTAANKAYGSNQSALYDGKFALYSGDVSDALLGRGYQDGLIESRDYSDMENSIQVFLTGYVPEDITGDQVVESTDYSIIENNIGSFIGISHP